MSLKGVEMQIAVPRTSEATHIQHQLNQKPAQDQTMLASQQTKEAEMRKRKSAEVEQSAFLHVKDEDAGTSNGGSGGRGRKRDRRGESPSGAAADMTHPYKGKHIDITL